MATATIQKALGSFYTEESVARSIVKWAIRDVNDSVLDPSCGGGVFLSSANELLQGRGSRAPKIWGIDVDEQALGLTNARVHGANLLQKDFFAVKPTEIPFFDAIVGNPPFIRYQSFNGLTRSSALARAREVGVHLRQLSSSWAPFLIHAVSFLRKGGRLGMVVPAELGHAQYAKEVLNFLLGKFGRIRIFFFRNKLFPQLSEDTGLLLCEEFEKRCTWLSVSILNKIEQIDQNGHLERPVSVEAVRSGQVRLTHFLLGAKVRDLYIYLSQQEGVTRLGTTADVGIGYVTGHNDYFHLSIEESRRWRIPSRFLRPAVLSLANCKGVLLKRRDWEELRSGGEKSYLFAVPGVGPEDLPGSIVAYLNHGREMGVPKRFKCKVRDPWYSVPHVRVADAFLSYMSGLGPRLVRNRARLVAPNTLHLVRFDVTWKSDPLIGGWYSSLTKLSCELEGHPLGGGMLKLEPSEAENVLIARPYAGECSQLLRRLDELFRKGENDRAVDLVDRIVLRRKLGLSATECLALRDGAAEMHRWRMHK